MAETVRWGIIGCGDVCEVKSGPAFQKADGSELVAVMRRDADKAADYARRHGVPTWYDDAAQLINDPNVSAVYVATPTGFHRQYALAAAEAGKPCYVEKPMARSYAECVEMIQAFQRANLPLFVAYYRRGHRRFLRAKELVEAGRLGRITNVGYRLTQRRHHKTDPDNLPWRVQAHLGGAGEFLDLACHTLDALDFILGPVAEAAGRAANLATPQDTEDGVAMFLRYECGALGTASWNFAGAAREDEIVITGTDGRLRMSTFGTEAVELHTPDGDVETFDEPTPEHVQQPLIQSIVDELLGRGTCPSTGSTAARTNWVMDRALESYYGSREGAFWEDPQRWPGRPDWRQEP